MKVAKPLKGHAFHAYTEAMLLFVIKDAGKAMSCAMDINDRNFGKYADQICDARTILHYREKTKKETK